jgi:hypothetical protein
MSIINIIKVQYFPDGRAYLNRTPTANLMVPGNKIKKEIKHEFNTMCILSLSLSMCEIWIRYDTRHDTTRDMQRGHGFV